MLSIWECPYCRTKQEYVRLTDPKNLIEHLWNHPWNAERDREAVVPVEKTFGSSITLIRKPIHQ